MRLFGTLKFQIRWITTNLRWNNEKMYFLEKPVSKFCHVTFLKWVTPTKSIMYFPNTALEIKVYKKSSALVENDNRVHRNLVKCLVLHLLPIIMCSYLFFFIFHILQSVYQTNRFKKLKPNLRMNNFKRIWYRQFFARDYT